MNVISAIKDWLFGKTYELEPLGFEVQSKNDGESYTIEFHNDKKTNMEFVVYIFEQYLDLKRDDAVLKMLEIHRKNSSTIGSFDRESAEKLVDMITKMSEKYAFPFKCNIKKA